MRTYSIIFVIVVSIVIGCGQKPNALNEDVRKKETISIITWLYNLESIPIPPPPPIGMSFEESKLLLPDVDKEYESQKLIYKRKFAISIVQEGEIDPLDIKSFPIELKEVFSDIDNEFSNENLIDLNLQDSYGNHIPILKKKELKIVEITEKYDVLGVLFISNISINKEANKAVISFGSYTHGLAGYNSILALKKVKGKWSVVANNMISES